jgi:hypothetical protein
MEQTGVITSRGPAILLPHAPFMTKASTCGAFKCCCIHEKTPSAHGALEIKIHLHRVFELYLAMLHRQNPENPF